MGDDSSEEIVGPLLSTFQGVQREVQHHVNDGVYKFLFALPQQERAEERGTDGKVIGSFAFVDPHGEEVSLTFDAGSYGYLPQSAHLPQSPVDTLEVQQARQNFLASYQRVAEYLDDLHSDEDSDSDESSEESLEDLFGESSEEDSDEDSDEDEDKK
ncbi:cuticle protein 6-like [Oratosquilla oratoria]|uniref:cuticle protein 6-like n=1 Tax=Oratosquilla oratoria TaxID=337810 RepID=UPI003F76084E